MDAKRRGRWVVRRFWQGRKERFAEPLHDTDPLRNGTLKLLFQLISADI